MNKEEAQKFIQFLKDGKTFGTRFQEQEWGLSFIEENKFQKWSRSSEFFMNEDGKMDGRQNYSEDILTEQELLELFTQHYDYKIMIARLR